MEPPPLQEHPPAPRRRGLLAALGPGILVAATGVGAGDIAGAGFAGSRLGYAVLWAALLGAFIKFVVNEGLTRWQLATGQTLLEGMVRRFGWPFHLFFGVYLLVWSFGVGTSLISASGVALHGLVPVFDDPARGKVVWGITQNLAAVGLILFGSYKAFERLMTALLVLMFASVVAAAGMFRHDWAAVAAGLVVPRIPHEAGPDGVQWTLALMGGVGGTLTVLCYGYWIRESGRTGPADLRLCRLDLGVAYLGSGLFGVAMVMLATGTDLAQGGGEAMMITIADKLGEVLGRPFRYVFLLGAWGAVVTSLLGVWQAVPYLFADFWSLLAGRYRPAAGTGGGGDRGADEGHGVGEAGGGADDRGTGEATPAARAAVDRRSTPYRAYLIGLATVPMLGLFTSFVLVQKAQAMLGAVVMPMLALALLILNGRSDLVGRAYRNRPVTVLVLLAVLAFFAYAGYLAIAKGKVIVS